IAHGEVVLSLDDSVFSLAAEKLRETARHIQIGHMNQSPGINSPSDSHRVWRGRKWIAPGQLWILDAFEMNVIRELRNRQEDVMRTAYDGRPKLFECGRLRA